MNKLLHLNMAIPAALWLCQAVSAQNVISVNFDGQAGTGTPGPVTGVAGSIPVDNWNNSGVSVLNGPLSLVDDAGSPTTATVLWSVENQWTTNGGNNSGGDVQMMQGYLDNFHDRPPIEVTGIPASFQASGYELRIYHNTDSGGTMGFTVSDDGGLTSTTYYSHQPGGNNSNYPLAGADPFGGAAGYIGSQSTARNTTVPSNYTLFTGLTGSSLRITGVRGSSGDTRSRPNGFQIVAKAVPGAPMVENNPATGITARSARLNGTVTDVGTAAPVVTIYYGDNDGLANPEDWDNALELPGTWAGAFSANVTDLNPGRTYYYRSYASNASGARWAPASDSFQTGVEPPALANLPATGIMTNSAEIGAEVTSTGGEVPLVTVYYGLTDGGTTEGDWDSFALLGAQSGVATTTVTGLQTGRSYFYRARGVNGGGTVWAPATASFATAEPAPPSVVNRGADGVRGGSANLRGEVTENGFDAPAITIYYGDNDGGIDPTSWDSAVTIGQRTGQFSLYVSDLVPLTTYYFRCRATNVAGTAWAPGSETFTTTDLLSSSIVINEIHYDHEPKTERGEFIEIFNPSDSPVPLTGWQINGAIDFDFPEGTVIAANGFLVIAEDPAAMRSVFGVRNALGPYVGRLSNDGERLELENENGSLVDEVDYGIGFPWPTASRGGGTSMELINENLDNDLGSSWRASGNAAPAGAQVTYVEAGQSWRYRKGTSEASNPVDAWRMQGFSEDETWVTGTAGFGYGDSDDTTTLDDMRNNYASVFLRKEFNLTGTIPTRLEIRVYHDDGAIVWINGEEVARVSVDQGDLTYRGARASDPPGAAPGSAVNNQEATWTDILFLGAQNTLQPGVNTVAVQGFNSTLSSSDFSLDCEVKTPPPGNPDNAATGDPTPGAANSVYAANAPPNIRQVEHGPSQPAEGQEVVVTAKVTDPDGVANVTLTYQLVEPGSYVHKEDSAYENGWVPLAMVDDGTGGDEAAGDSVFTVTMPAGLQVHRRLIRYRITVEDVPGNAQQTPYEDDESPNFAYFCYNGVPDWSGSKRPGVLRSVNYRASALDSIAVYHLITKESDVIQCQWSGPTDGVYRYLGTWVYDGKVYDHMRYRIRGNASVRQAGKNKWKFNFNRARPFEARDNYGRRYDVPWDKINGLAATNPWWRNNVATDGTVYGESLGFRLYQLAGGLASNTQFYHFRVIDKVAEAPSDQYDGDFWGLYIAVEQPDIKFLEARNMPDGNLYNVHGGSGSTKRAQGSNQVSDKSDLFAFQGLHSSGTPQSRWEANLDFDHYFAFNAMNLAINNSDMRPQDNVNYYHNSETGKWHILPWDIDLTFEDAPHWGRGDTSAWESIYHCLQYSSINQAYENKVREILNLLLDNDQSPHLVDEFAGFLTKGGRQNIVEAGQAVWDYHPRKTKKGIWYGNFNSSLLPSRSFAGLTQYTKDFLTVRGYGRSNLASKAVDSAIPYKPTIGYTGPDGYPVDGLAFQSSSFNDPQGRSTFGSMEWRIGEIRNPDTPNYVEGDRYIYEIETYYQSDRLTPFQGQFTFPTAEVRPGRTYRARVRHLDNSGRASHWSNPVEFTATTPDLDSWTSNLMVTEVHYNPLPASAAEIAAGFVTSDFEFIEIQNISSTLTLDLTDIRFTKGIDFDFADGVITSLAPGAYALVVRNEDAFESRYGAGLPVAGSYGPDNLSNGGENVKLSFGAGVTIQEFHYLDVAPWPSAPDGTGVSLALVNPAVAPDHADPFNWRASVTVGGSPGEAEQTASLVNWRNDNFTAAELADPSISGDAVDIDLDGMNTIMEYAFVGDPRSPDPEHLPQLLTVTDGGVDYIGLAMRRRLDAGDLIYEVQVSDDLRDWTVESDAVTVSSVANGDGSVTEILRLPGTMASAGRMFLRVRVTVL
ncbi:MAG: lamin tail domain-containing protein [Roseibacillus sp.]|nr:lamin tail domain-containing protein [Roseibacillus sp.]